MKPDQIHAAAVLWNEGRGSADIAEYLLLEEETIVRFLPEIKARAKLLRTDASAKALRAWHK